MKEKRNEAMLLCVFHVNYVLEQSKNLEKKNIEAEVHITWPNTEVPGRINLQGHLCFRILDEREMVKR